MSWGLALSGGAAYGIANAGVIEALEEHGLRPDFVAGSSMGAIVGAVYALGNPPSALRNLCEELHVLSAVKIAENPLQGGLHGGLLRPRLQELLTELIGDACIGDCRIPFTCIAGRVLDPIAWHKILKKGFVDHFLERVTPYVFPKETKLMDAILASSAIPVIFSPMEVEGHEYVDLVHFGSIPSRILRNERHPDIVIATDTNPTYKNLRNILPSAWDTFLQEGEKQLDLDRKDADVLIVPEHPYAIFRFDKSLDFYEAGKKAVEEKFSELKVILKAHLK